MNFFKNNWQWILLTILVLCLLFLIVCVNNFGSTPNMTTTSGPALVAPTATQEVVPAASKIHVVPAPVATEKFEPFDNNTKRGPFDTKPAIILYYAEWCGFSKMFLPIWEKFSVKAASQFPNLTISKLRCEGDMEEMCVQKGIQGYPTVKFYKANGDEVPFSGERNEQSLTAFVQHNM